MMKKQNSFVHDIVKIALSSLVLLAASHSSAEELQVIELEGTQIRGSQELPSVSYIVPWQPPIPADIQAPDSLPVSVSNMKPIERGEFRRIIGFHEQFLSAQQAAKASLTESSNPAE